jgi:crotonobetainyl-CoA:carnitine CoA-transferase CaiB-like acyl-CoA transferase
MTGNNKEYAKMPVAFIDVLAAHQIKEGILTALILQNQEKKPYKVSTTLEETAIASLMNQSSNYLMANHQSKPMGTLHPNIAPYGEIVTTIDNKELILAIGTDHQFENFSKIISLDISIVKKFKTNSKRVKKRIELISALKEKIENISSQYLLSSCLKKNIPIGEINSIKKVLESKLAKEMVLEEKINNQLTKRIKTVAFNLTS